MFENPQPNSTASATRSLPVRRRFPRTSRSAVTNDPRFMTKGSPTPRAVDRRRRDLVEAFLAALGPDGVTDLSLLMVRKAAELTVAAELARAGMLTGTSPSDVTGLIKLENAARRAVLALGLRVEPASKQSSGLAIARARWEEQRVQARKAREATTAPTNTEEPPSGRAA
jgi:hypothetical protein